jgi:hypothetical protein
MNCVDLHSGKQLKKLDEEITVGLGAHPLVVSSWSTAIFESQRLLMQFESNAYSKMRSHEVIYEASFDVKNFLNRPRP